MKNTLKTILLSLSLITLSTTINQAAVLTNSNVYVQSLGGFTNWITNTNWITKLSIPTIQRSNILSVVSPVWEQDESIVIPTILQFKSTCLVMLCDIFSRDIISLSNRNLIAAEILSRTNYSGYTAIILHRYPVNERMQFISILTNANSVFNGGYPPGFNPVATRMRLDSYLTGDVDFSKNTNIASMIVGLLAPEPIDLYFVTSCKKRINSLTSAAARLYLRSNGKTFVVGTNGVNPVVELVQPVTDALNAPLCIGLEAALNNIGISTPTNDRTALIAWGNTYTNQVMLGLVAPAIYVGKISVFLGTTNYNNWINLYNNGE